jgi:hypothetical protein
VGDVEARLARLDHMLERTHHLTFLCFRMLLKERPEFKAALEQEMAASKTSLANSLVERFGQ